MQDSESERYLRTSNVSECQMEFQNSILIVLMDVLSFFKREVFGES